MLSGLIARLVQIPDVLVFLLAFMLVAHPTTVFLCALPVRRAKWNFRGMPHVLNARNRRDSRRTDHCLSDFHHHPDPGGHHQVAGKKLGVLVE